MKDAERHLKRFAEKKPNDLLFDGEKGAPFRRLSFGRKWHRARATVRLPENFRFYGLRYTGPALATQTGETLKVTMVRARQSSERAALMYQHSSLVRQQEIADALGARVRADGAEGALTRLCRTPPIP